MLTLANIPLLFISESALEQECRVSRRSVSVVFTITIVHQVKLKLIQDMYRRNHKQGLAGSQSRLYLRRYTYHPESMYCVISTTIPQFYYTIPNDITSQKISSCKLNHTYEAPFLQLYDQWKSKTHIFLGDFDSLKNTPFFCQTSHPLMLLVVALPSVPALQQSKRCSHRDTCVQGAPGKVFSPLRISTISTLQTT